MIKVNELKNKLLNRKRTIQDKLISSVINARNTIYEPIRLKYERKNNLKKYENLDEPLVSVTTTTLNRGKIFRERALESVLSQTYKNFEYIIIGDNCTDDTAEIVKKINDKRIKFFNLPFRKKRYPFKEEYAGNHWYVGSSFGSNIALEKSSGDWIAKIDDWAIWTKNNLETMINNSIKRKEIEFFTGSTLYNNQKTIGNMAFSEYFRLNKNTINNEDVMIGPTQTFFYRSYLKFFRWSVQSWRKDWNKNNDHDLIVRMFSTGVRFGWVNEVMAIIKPRPGLTSVNSQAFLESLINDKHRLDFK
jgi:glycosyltransferase involved in cell wall biosynthesis